MAVLPELSRAPSKAVGPNNPTPQPPRRRGGNIYFLATVVAQVAALLRYVCLARLLGPEQLGMAATLVVTASFFDLISDTGSDRFLVQDRHGNEPSAQQLVQLVFIVRGVLIALALLVLAVPLASFYKVPQLAIGFSVLALSPLILGFTHLDNRRAQRSLDFRAEAVTMMWSETVGFAATLTAALVTQSFTAILYGLIGRALVVVAVSHLRSERPYAIGYAHQHARRLATFGGPLMLSGLMLFIGSQGDRVVVANQLGVKILGQYSAVLLLIFYPSAVLMKYMISMYIPLVARHRDDNGQRNEVLNRIGGQTLLLSLAMAGGFALVAPPMVSLLYGNRFKQSAIIVSLIGILQTARFMINWPTTAALAEGHSRTVLGANMARVLVFPGALLGVRLFGGLAGLVAGFIMGELIAVATGLVLLSRNRGRSALDGMDRYALFLATSAAIISGAIATTENSAPGLIAASFAFLASIAIALHRERRVLRDASAWLSTTINVFLLRAKTLRP
jgi:O-antigen/teichoic acid export membrane protein